MAISKNFFIIDAHGFLHRNYHALPKLTTSKGEEVGALYGFVNWLFRFLREKSPLYTAICFDSKGPTFRHNIYKEYKANRPPIDEELKSQLAIARDFCSALGFKVVALSGAEADDLMASCAKIAKKENQKTVIITSDKDIYQIAGGLVQLWSGSWHDSYRADDACKTKFNVPCQYMTDYLSLLGDSSDNVPGVNGIGAKTASELINTFGNLDSIYDAVKNNDTRLKEKLKNKLIEGETQAKLSRELVLLKQDLLDDLTLQDFKVLPPNIKELETFYNRFEFQTLKSFINENSAKQKQEIKQTQETPTFVQGELFAFDDEEPKQETPKIEQEVKNFQTILDSAKNAFEIFIYVEDDILLLALNKEEFSYKQIKDLTPQETETLFNIIEDDSTLKIGHDLKYTFRLLDFTPENKKFLNTYDIMLAGYSLDPSSDFSIINSLSLYTKTFINDNADIKEKLPLYAKNVWALKQYFDNELKNKQQENVFKEMETPLQTILLSMEQKGILIDQPWLKTLSILLEKELNKKEEEIKLLAGNEININSPKQLGELLFEKLKLPILKKTKTGYSTDEEVLQGLKHLHPIAELILEYRESAKLKTTYVDSLSALTDTKTRRIHTNFNQTGTVTGRLSSFNPNLQNIPNRTEKGRLIRQSLCADIGKVLLSLDYSQIDLRVLAHESADETLIHSFKSGDDIHTRTASEVFNVPINEVSKEQRSHAKGINFGIVYGQGPMALAQTLDITMAQAKEYIENYFARYDTVKSWINKSVANAKKLGYVKTLGGHIRYLPEFSDPNPRMVSFASRAAVNTIVQGGSSDIIKKAMLDIYKVLPDDVSLLLQIHDELIFEVPDDKLKQVASLLKQKMENALILKVPLIVSAKAGKNLSQMGVVNV